MKSNTERIFTHVLHKTFTQGAVGTEGPNPVETWSPQEDIEVVGCWLYGELEVISENDCQTGGWFGLKSGAMMDLGGWLGRINWSGLWNTSPAAVQKEYANVAVIFPKGQAVTVREGETLNLFASVRSVTAGEHTYSLGAIVYYIPKGVRR